MLIHLIDIAGQDPAEAMRIVEEELSAYGAGLEDKPRLVALNKLDLADRELGEAFSKELIAAGADQVFTVSGASGEGIDALLDAVLGYLPDRTATETKTVEVEDVDDLSDEEGSGGWSPI